MLRHKTNGNAPTLGCLCLLYGSTCINWSVTIHPDVLDRPPQITDLSIPSAFDLGPYQTQLQAQLAELRDFVESYATQAANKQKFNDDQHSASPEIP